MLPSATEVIYLLGLGDLLTGVSHECDYPPPALGKRKIVRAAIQCHGLSSHEIDGIVRESLRRGEAIYQIDVEQLKAADPDLILTQALCEVCAAPYQYVQEAVTQLRRKPDILSLNPKGLEDVLKDVERVGEATGRVREAEAAVALLRGRIQRVAERAATVRRRPRVLCLEWLDPLMASGHWVPEMVALAGGQEVLGNLGAPAARIEWDRVSSFAPEILFLMPCGFTVDQVLHEVPLLTKLPGWKDLPAVQRGKVYAVHGHAYYSRSGPRLVDGLEILAHLMHPALFPGPIPEGAAEPVDR